MSDDRITTQDMASPRTTGDEPDRRELDPDEPARSSSADAARPDAHADQADHDLPPPPPPPPPPAARSTPDDEGRSAADEGRHDVMAEDPSAADGPVRDSDATEHGPLLDTSASADYQQRWDRLQIDFVDRPRETVAEADELVAEVLQRIAQTFADERSTLEQQWSGDGDPSTEELRVALQRYRSFFSRLLST